LQKINPVDSSITDGDVKVQVEYYIIVQSNRNLRQAQQKAEELTNKYNTNFIVLPRTKEGFYRISYGKYSKLEEVNSIIKGIRTNIRSDAWILSLPAQEGL
jgi:isocitrate lyase